MGGGRLRQPMQPQQQQQQQNPNQQQQNPNQNQNQLPAFLNGMAEGADVMEHVVGRVFMLAKSQSGSRFIQEKLAEPQWQKLFFDELKTHVPELMMDSFGHYAIEALFQVCGEEERLALLVAAASMLSTCACHRQGSFSVQAMMDSISSNAQIQVLCDALTSDIHRLCVNTSGHYVVLRFLQRFSYPWTQFVHDSIAMHTVHFATDHYGLRVLKAVIDAGPVAEMTEIFNQIVRTTPQLVENQYGNYIVQHVIDVAPKQISDQIRSKMQGKFVGYSKQKFSSNVVEKCLRSSEKEWRELILKELLNCAGEVVSDKYGNYCMQTALSLCDRAMCQNFIQRVVPHLGGLRENVKQKWRKLMELAASKHMISVDL